MTPNQNSSSAKSSRAWQRALIIQTNLANVSIPPVPRIPAHGVEGGGDTHTVCVYVSTIFMLLDLSNLQPGGP